MFKSRCLLVLGLIACVALLATLRLAGGQPLQPLPPARAPVHGLKGYYYTGAGPKDDPNAKGVSSDEFWMPTPNKPADAERIDPQIAFGRGKGKGFILAGTSQVAWFAHPDARTVIWKGYIRFPKAGAYFLTTVSYNGAAVYLNKARVSLCGSYGYRPPNEPFVFDKPGLDMASSETSSYLVPVPIDRPSVLPIEVRFVMQNASSTSGYGIDLYWVTPDAKRDDKGKPIAELVPSEALFVDPPEEVAPATASRPHCTLQSDRLYLTYAMDKPATLTIRVADKRGRPLAGKRVHLSQLVNRGAQGTIVQTEKLTDANGETTALFREGRGGGGPKVRLFATVLGDLVDVGQVAEINMVAPKGLSFFPDAYSPYYDPKGFQIEPRPPVAGKPAVFTIPVKNNQKVAARLFVSLSGLEWNIGATGWKNLGESERFTLQPGETKVVKITWSPKADEKSICYKVFVSGWLLKAKADAGGGANLASLVTLLHVQEPAAPAGEPTAFDSRQQNVGQVGRDPREFEGPPAPLPPGGYKAIGVVYINPLGNAVFDRPSANSKVVAHPGSGLRFVYHAYVVKDGVVTWYYLKPPGDVDGWISSSDVRLRPPPATPPPHKLLPVEDSGSGPTTAGKAARTTSHRG